MKTFLKIGAVRTVVAVNSGNLSSTRYLHRGRWKFLWSSRCLDFTCPTPREKLAHAGLIKLSVQGSDMWGNQNSFWTLPFGNFSTASHEVTGVYQAIHHPLCSLLPHTVAANTHISLVRKPTQPSTLSACLSALLPPCSLWHGLNPYNFRDKWSVLYY